MLESMARAGGKKTGLYTSPHLCRFAERIRIDGEPLTDDALADVLERALEIGPDLSFFETATLAAFLAFRDANVDVAIIEVRHRRSARCHERRAEAARHRDHARRARITWIASATPSS